MNLIELYNQRYDYVRKINDLDYVGCSGPKGSTHRLICTRWNSEGLNEKDFLKWYRARKTRPAGFALAVCAEPLKRRKARRPAHLLRRGTPWTNLPVYDLRATLAGKRAVLTEYLAQHKTRPTMLKKLKKLCHADCDRLYRQLRLANTIALLNKRRGR